MYIMLTLPGHWWTGGHRSSNGTFYWYTTTYEGKLKTGKPISYTNWYPKEPNNHLGAEDAIEIRSEFGTQWNDKSVNQQNYFVCEYNPLTGIR